MNFDSVRPYARVGRQWTRQNITPHLANCGHSCKRWLTMSSCHKAYAGCSKTISEPWAAYPWVVAWLTSKKTNIFLRLLEHRTQLMLVKWYSILTEMKQHSEQKEQHIAVKYKEKIKSAQITIPQGTKRNISVVYLHNQKTYTTN